MASPAVGVQKSVEQPVREAPKKVTYYQVGLSLAGLVIVLLAYALGWAHASGQSQQQLTQNTSDIRVLADQKVSKEQWEEYTKRVDLGFTQLNQRLDHIEQRLDRH